MASRGPGRLLPRPGPGSPFRPGWRRRDPGPALAERSRIAGELHDVLAHSLSGLAIQLQGARKLAGREQVSDGLRATIERSADLAKAGLADAKQAVGALRGERLPTVDQLSALVEGFRRDTGTEATCGSTGHPGRCPRRPAWRCSAAPRRR